MTRSLRIALIIAAYAVTAMAITLTVFYGAGLLGVR